jgi:hypothetical protein
MSYGTPAAWISTATASMASTSPAVASPWVKLGQPATRTRGNRALRTTPRTVIKSGQPGGRARRRRERRACSAPTGCGVLPRQAPAARWPQSTALTGPSQSRIEHRAARRPNPHNGRSGYRTSSPVTARPMIIRWISDVPSKIVKIVDYGPVSAGQRPARERDISTDSAPATRGCRPFPAPANVVERGQGAGQEGTVDSATAVGGLPVSGHVNLGDLTV